LCPLANLCHLVIPNRPPTAATLQISSACRGCIIPSALPQHLQPWCTVSLRPVPALCNPFCSLLAAAIASVPCLHSPRFQSSLSPPSSGAHALDLALWHGALRLQRVGVHGLALFLCFLRRLCQLRLPLLLPAFIGDASVSSTLNAATASHSGCSGRHASHCACAGFILRATRLALCVATGHSLRLGLFQIVCLRPLRRLLPDCRHQRQTAQHRTPAHPSTGVCMIVGSAWAGHLMVHSDARGIHACASGVQCFTDACGLCSCADKLDLA
jgi:hypothetical protein